MGKPFFSSFALALLLAAPAAAMTICTPRTVTARDWWDCEAAVYCQSGETPTGGGCAYKRCRGYKEEFTYKYGKKTGWRCSGGSNYYDNDYTVTASVTCCKEVADPPPPPPPKANTNYQTGNQDKSNTQETQAATKQTQAVKSAAQVSMLGAGQAATIGAIDCADGANQMLQDEEAGSGVISSCFRSLSAARQLEELALKNGETGKAGVDEEVLSQDGHKKTLAEFEKNFGMDGKEFVRKMVSAGPDRAVLGAFLGAKIPEEKLPEASAGTKNAKAEAPAPAPQGAPADYKTPTEMAEEAARASVEKGKKSGRRLSSAVADMPDTLSDSYLIMGETITPLNDPMFEAARKDITRPAPEERVEYDELTLFDIVHRKYRQKAMMLAPRRPGQ